MHTTGLLLGGQYGTVEEAGPQGCLLLVIWSTLGPRHLTQHRHKVVVVISRDDVRKLPSTNHLVDSEGVPREEGGINQFNLRRLPVFVNARSRVCLSSIILSPLNGNVKMSPYETGDIHVATTRALKGSLSKTPTAQPCGEKRHHGARSWLLGGHELSREIRPSMLVGRPKY